jgi:hypothetical protein
MSEPMPINIEKNNKNDFPKVLGRKIFIFNTGSFIGETRDSKSIMSIYLYKLQIPDLIISDESVFSHLTPTPLLEKRS